MPLRWLRVYIKKFWIGLLLGTFITFIILGLAIWQYAHANTGYISGLGETANLNALQESTLFNTSGYLVEPPVLESPIEKKPIKAPLSKDFCSCVAWVKAQTGYTKIVGAAKNWPINSLVPQIGAVVITNESSWGHVAIVTNIQDDFLVLAEANYSKCRQTNGRKLPINSKLIKGYYNF